MAAVGQEVAAAVAAAARHGFRLLQHGVFPFGVFLSWSLEKIVGGKDTSLICNGKGVVPPGPAARMKSGGEEQPAENTFYNIEVGEKTGSRWRAAAAMPLKGRSDAARYGGRKKGFQRRFNGKLMRFQCFGR